MHPYVQHTEDWDVHVCGSVTELDTYRIQISPSDVTGERLSWDIYHLNYNMAADGNVIDICVICQYTEEKLGQAEVTEYDAHLDNLIQKADRTKYWTERILSQTETVLQPNPSIANCLSFQHLCCSSSAVSDYCSFLWVFEILLILCSFSSYIVVPWKGPHRFLTEGCMSITKSGLACV